jgi:hypothetical protein
MKLYEYTVTTNEKAGDLHPKILVPTTLVLAIDEIKARDIAARAVPAEFGNKMEQVDLRVRKFLP